MAPGTASSPHRVRAIFASMSGHPRARRFHRGLQLRRHQAIGGIGGGVLTEGAVPLHSALLLLQLGQHQHLAHQHLAHRPTQNLRGQRVPVQRTMDHKARQIHAARRSRDRVSADPFPLRIGRHHGALAAPAGILPHRRHPPDRACSSDDTQDTDYGIRLTKIPTKLLMRKRIASFLWCAQNPSTAVFGSYTRSYEDSFPTSPNATPQ